MGANKWHLRTGQFDAQGTRDPRLCATQPPPRFRSFGQSGSARLARSTRIHAASLSAHISVRARQRLEHRRRWESSSLEAKGMVLARGFPTYWPPWRPDLGEQHWVRAMNRGGFLEAVWLAFRAELRRRWRSWLAIALLISVVGGFVLAATAAGRRTQNAFPQFVVAHGFDAVVYANQPVPRVATLPGVVS